MSKQIIGYYYCSVSTFQNILKNNSVHLSDPLKMNDKSEIRWALKLIKNNSNFADLFNRLGYGDEWKKLPTSFNYYRDYMTRICCFSKNNNLLSQWRAYADDGCGLAIGFDLEQLAGDYYNLFVDDIEYLNDGSNIEFPKDFPTESIISHFRAARLNFDEIVQEFIPYFLTIKAPYFSEENEIRIIYQENSKLAEFYASFDAEFGIPLVKHLDNGYRLLNNNNIIKYSELKFSPNAIHRVMIGPKCRITKDEVDSMIKFYFKTKQDTYVTKSHIQMQ